ncbi:glycosyltransferase involved in cell wall biosynthesis [Dysgonomonas sp. PH5-45]|uniref:glycosyltransferase family 2 protein n=1 Tax=unclassified Dysgonomonas TaxID=2630389 RepID=UPI002474E43F|nr:MULTISPECIES: glycosyltransferase family 2 protein [unclassified Dysgonomonas]MDH6356058.1 glycosyltransferase involved in cell wall biosynthesis [Dysgonomonas sp. PH5-45]MDH6388952.1 glycosyltransferase involved in cell wall biosynthesis [Dysgonomonas sp. PH5-37]
MNHIQNHKPTISVVTVVYNAKSIIEETILSVIKQDYENIEYIIIDGGSKDGTTDIIRKYESKLAYWHSKPDKGIYNAMNKGIDIASGDWVIFMNAGDSFYKEDVLSSVFLNNDFSEYDVVYGNTVYHIPYFSYLEELEPITNMPYRKPFCHQAAFTKLKIHKQYKFDEKYKICADYNFFYQLYFKGYKFKSIDCIITLFDCIDSTSLRIIAPVAKEVFKIQGIESKRIIYTAVLKKLIRNKASHFLKSFWSKKSYIKWKTKKLQSNPRITWFEKIK